MKDYELEINVKSEAKITQQKGSRIPIQLQEQVDKEIEKVLKEGNIEKVDKFQDDVFIQPTVITVKKDVFENCTRCEGIKSINRQR